MFIHANLVNIIEFSESFVISLRKFSHHISQQMNYSFLDFMALIGSVGLFLYGMKVMSEGLQKAAGDRLRNILSVMTRNRFSGLLTGIAITAIIQSSSASTVMVVSFVNAGLMTLAQSMAVIFGANVGTTFTAWIIALLGFKMDTSVFILPLIACSVPLLFCNTGRKKSIGEFLIGFSLLFMGLNMISVYVPDLQSNPEMFAFLEHYASMGYASVLLFLFVGMVLTAVIQSSAATFAIVLIMCTKGWISFDLACAVVLGSNIGTTITPLLASLSGNIAAKRTAMGHLLFNLFGLLWTLVVFYPFVRLNVGITEALGQGNPDEMFSFVNNLEATDPQTYNAYVGETLPASHPILAQVAKMQFSVSFGLSMFHTVFNLVNVMIMIWLTGVYVKIVEKIMPAKNKEDGEFQLRFISAGLLSASELNIAQAEKEMVVYAQRVRRMVTILETFAHTDSKTEDYSRLYSRLEKYEDISDRMQLEISNYLRRCSEGRLSNEAKSHVVAMLNIASEIESIADCCYRSAKILVRKSEQSIEFDNIIIENIDSMFSYVKEAKDNMIRHLANIEHVREADIVKSYNKEREINNLRNQLRTGNVKNINNHVYEFQAGNFYMDIINDLEKMGDYIINVTGTIRDSYLRHTV